MNEIKFAIPGIYSHFRVNVELLYLMQTKPDWFRPNISIGAVYGIFPYCIWDGGRIFKKYYQVSAEDITHILDTYKQFNVPIRLILTNNQLEENDYYDHFGNIMLKLCESNTAEIVCADDNFRDYIHQNYPDYKFVSSTTKCLNKQDFVKELDKLEYYQVCLDYNLNKNTRLFEQLSTEQRDKCEFLINAVCPPGCPNRRRHYIQNSLFHLFNGKNYQVPECPIDEGTVSVSTCNYANNLSPEEVENYYKTYGFTHFKLEGRSLPDSEIIGNYVRYFIKPEHQLNAFVHLVEVSQIKE